MSLRTKGLIAFGMLVLYIVIVGVLVEHQRQNLFVIVQDLERIHASDEALGRVSYSVGHAILAVNEGYFRTDGDLTNIILSGEIVQSGLAELARQFPELGASGGRIEQTLARVIRTKRRDALIDFRESLHRVVAELDEVAAKVRAAKKSISDRYRFQYDAITMVGASLGTVGMVAFGGLITLFFTRLASDIRKLQQRSIEVVNGYRGPRMDITRGDEIGDLMQSLNRMQDALREREAGLEISRMEHFHREKMAAIGNLAAAIAHEINNPIAAIAGIAQSMTDVQKLDAQARKCEMCNPKLILDEAKRISAITRQIAHFTRPQPLEPQLLDLNGLIESTSAFVLYDRRFRSVELKTDLDAQLPAVHGVADRLTQVLMNLLINAADALEGVSDADSRRIEVRTRAQGDEVVMTVTDNGCGMDEEVKARVFDEFFSTKPPGKGSGIGLALCRRLVREGSGEIDVESTRGAGTTVSVRLPTTRVMPLAVP